VLDIQTSVFDIPFLWALFRNLWTCHFK